MESKEKKKGFWTKLMEKLDKKMEDKSKAKPCCNSGQKGKSCCS